MKLLENALESQKTLNTLSNVHIRGKKSAISRLSLLVSKAEIRWENKKHSKNTFGLFCPTLLSFHPFCGWSAMTLLLGGASCSDHRPEEAPQEPLLADGSGWLFFYVHPLTDEGTKNGVKWAGSGYTAEGGVQQKVWCQPALRSAPWWSCQWKAWQKATVHACILTSLKCLVVFMI